MTQQTAEDERQAIVAWLRKKVQHCEDYRDRMTSPHGRRGWQQDIDIYNSIADKIERRDHLEQST